MIKLPGRIFLVIMGSSGIAIGVLRVKFTLEFPAMHQPLAVYLALAALYIAAWLTLILLGLWPRQVSNWFDRIL